MRLKHCLLTLTSAAVLAWAAVGGWQLRADASAAPSADGEIPSLALQPTTASLSDLIGDESVKLLAPNPWLASRAPGVQKAASADDFCGYFITRNASFFESKGEYNNFVTIAKTDGNITVSNLYGIKVDVPATYNAQSGKLEIAVQPVYQHEKYGACSFAPAKLEGTRVVPERDKKIELTLNTDGSISMTPWGLFVDAGQYANSVFDAFQKSGLYLPNAKVSYTPFQSGAENQEYNALIQQETANTVIIANMLNNAKPYTVTLLGAGKGELTPQFVMTADVYGDFWLYSAGTDGKIKKTTPLLFKEAEGGYTIDPWGAYCLRSTGVCAANGKDTKVTTTFKVEWPVAGENPLSGTGASTDPYLLTKPEHFNWLAYKVASGTTFKNFYFALGSDVDFTGLDNLAPIGGMNEVSFDGTFDGKGFTLRNLKNNYAGFKYSGVFGWLGTSATVKNVNFEGFTVTSTGVNFGGLIGLSAGTVTNCHGKKITLRAGSTETGGIVGKATGAISECSFTGSIYGGNDCGGVVGYTESTVTNCHASTYILIDTYIPAPVGTHSAGAVIGAAKGKTSSNHTTLRGLYGSGYIYDPQVALQLGGVVGSMYNCDIHDSFSVTELHTNAGQGSSGTSPAAGGIVGYISVGTINNCYNAGYVGAPNCNFTGGICGYAGGMSNAIHEINSCYNSGIVMGNSEFEHCALIGNYFNPAILNVNNSYYDIQTTGVEYASSNPKSTKELTSGTALPGFSTDKWVFTAGMYPRLKAFKDTPEAVLSAVPFYIPEGENVRKVLGNITLGSHADVEWKGVDSEGNYVDVTDAFTINGSSLEFKNVYGLSRLAAISKTAEWSATGLNKLYTLKNVPKVFDGNGTAENPYLIKNTTDLLTLTEAVNTYLQPHRGDFFKLTADLDLKGLDFAGIGGNGSASRYFGGTFDGDNHAIKNFTLNAVIFDENGKMTGGNDYSGFFGIITKEAEVKNLVIDGSCTMNLYRQSGPVVGYALGKVSGCVNKANIKAYGNYNGGIAGVTDKTSVIENCTNLGDITGYGTYTGGITSLNYGLISGCYNGGDVIITVANDITGNPSPKSAGGIAGTNIGTITGSINAGNVTAPTIFGGIVGENSVSNTTYTGGVLTNNISYGQVLATEESTKCGALVGALASYETGTGNYYDNTINSLGACGDYDTPGFEGLGTAALTSGTAIEGLAEAGYSFKKDSYPVLSRTLPAEVSVFSGSFAKLSATDCAGYLSQPATLAAATGVKTDVKYDGGFTFAGNTLAPALGELAKADATITFGMGGFEKKLYVTAHKAVFAGAGTDADPHVIASADDMAKLAKAVNESGITYANHFFKLASDINFKDVAYTPVGLEKKPFNGHFDGNSKTLSGLKFGSNDARMIYMGVFGRMGTGSSVKNLNVENAYVEGYKFVGTIAGECAGEMTNCTNKGSIVVSDKGYVGGFAGYLAGGSKAEGLVNKALVSSNTGSFAGGITGIAYGDIYNCSNEETVTSSAASAYAGGIAGQFRGNAKNLVNKGDITPSVASSYLGGIFACLETRTTIENCENRGKITNGKSNVGGIYGTGLSAKGSYLPDGVKVKNCSNYTDIEGTSTGVGGVVGAIVPGQKVENCVNYGNVSTSAGTMGGVAGSLTGADGYPSAMINCENYGNINNTSTSNSIGGVVGKTASFTSLQGCYNQGKITAETANQVGGITGNATDVIEGCVNTGAVTGGTYAIGGICGYHGTSGYIDNCLNSGDVAAAMEYTASYGTVAGILGYGYKPITNCANFGSLTGVKNVGGIAGTTFAGNNQIVISNCYTTGKINVPDGAVNVGNLFATALAHGENNYYDSSVNPSRANDATTGVKGVSTSELLSLNPGNGFAVTPAKYPVPAKLSANAKAHLAAVTYLLDGQDTPGNITKAFTIGNHSDLTWTSSHPELISVADNKVTVNLPSTLTEVTLTASHGKYERKFEFTLAASSGIDDILNPGEGADSESQATYYDLQGRKVLNPAAGQVVIKLTGNKAVKVTVK